MKRSRLAGTLGVAVVGLLASCSDASPTGSEEVAGELRALRLMLAQQPRAAGGTAPAERVDVQAALAPLRAALDALANSQRELAERQLALTQEMQRWSQLLVESVGEARGEEAKANAAKLRELEASLRSQDARHREVEAMIQGALDKTADQLDAFLKRLQIVTPPAPAAQPAGPGGGQSPPPGGAGTGETDRREAGLDSRTHAAGRSSRWWWLGITGLGGAVATFFFRRNRRRQRPPDPGFGLDVPDALAGGKERSVEEIWAAANLLGEAVGRLRQRVAPSEGTPAGDPAIADLVGMQADEPAPVAMPPVATPTARPAVDGLETIVAHAAGAVGERQVLSALAAEPRVLRRPAPMLRRVDGGLEIRFHVLPGTSLGERSRLLARLQDNIRAARVEPAN